MRRVFTLLPVAVLLTAFAVTAFAATLPGAPAPIDSWGYQLQDADPAALADAGFDLYVIDYSADGSGAGAYTAQEIATVRAAGKTVLCYFSIGEAEEYRFYWDSAWSASPPAWLGPENPDWPGNYKVRYWMEDWWTTALAPYLDRILAAGFDGVYLDIVDGYYYWSQNGQALAFTSSEMVALIERILAYGRTTDPGFLVVPQNGLSLWDDADSADKTAYLNAIHAIGAEDLFYNADPADMAYRQGLLSTFLDAGKPILNVEYIGSAEYDAYRATVAPYGGEVVGYAALPDRNLDELNTGWLPASIPALGGLGAALLALLLGAAHTVTNGESR